jgi:hypothetical protein
MYLKYFILLFIIRSWSGSAIQKRRREKTQENKVRKNREKVEIKNRKKTLK